MKDMQYTKEEQDIIKHCGFSLESFKDWGEAIQSVENWYTKILYYIAFTQCVICHIIGNPISYGDTKIGDLYSSIIAKRIHRKYMKKR